MTIKNCEIGNNVKIWGPVNLYDSEIGDGTKIAAFVEIGGAKIGKHCKIEAFVFIPPGVEIGDYVFVGPHVCFTNDKYPIARTEPFQPLTTKVGNDVAIGANSTILPGIEIGVSVTIGAGSVVTKSILPGRKWIGTELVGSG